MLIDLNKDKIAKFFFVISANLHRGKCSTSQNSLPVTKMKLWFSK